MRDPEIVQADLEGEDFLRVLRELFGDAVGVSWLIGLAVRGGKINQSSGMRTRLKSTSVPPARQPPGVLAALIDTTVTVSASFGHWSAFPSTSAAYFAIVFFN